MQVCGLAPEIFGATRMRSCTSSAAAGCLPGSIGSERAVGRCMYVCVNVLYARAGARAGARVWTGT